MPKVNTFMTRRRNPPTWFCHTILSGDRVAVLAINKSIGYTRAMHALRLSRKRMLVYLRGGITLPIGKFVVPTKQSPDLVLLYHPAGRSRRCTCYK